MMTKIENELAKMKCHQNEILFFIRQMAKPYKDITTLLNEEIRILARIKAIARIFKSEDYPSEKHNLILFVETWLVLDQKIKRCTDFNSLKQTNLVAQVRIARVSNTGNTKIGSRSGESSNEVGVIGNARTSEDKRICFL